jgi:hypothetical protein
MQSADGQYGYDRPWQLFSETLASRRMDNNGPSWYPQVPPSPNPYDMIPPRFGWTVYADQPTIEDVLDNVFTRLQMSTVTATESDDWSGVQGGYQASMRPTGAGGMAVT